MPFFIQNIFKHIWRCCHPLRPFLRKQESHSHILPIMPKSTNNPPFPHKTIPAKAGISKGNARPPPHKRRRRWRHMVVRFLLPQEWSTCVRTIVGEYGVVCKHDTVRFLPSQEWSTGERKSIGEYGIIAARRCIVAANNRQNPHTLPFPHRPFLRRQESHITGGNAA